MATMVNQINLSVNNIIIIIFTLFILSCNKVDKQAHFNHYTSNDSISIDSSVNGITLADSNSILNQLGDISSYIIEDYDKGECVILSNKNKTQYLEIRRAYGGAKNEYNYFFILEEVPKEYQTKLIILPDIFFQTNKGAFLYMKEQDFLSRYKDLNLKRKIIKDTIIYTFNREDDIYESKYIFINKKLVEISFGYQD